MPRWTEDAKKKASQRMMGNQHSKGKNIGNQHSAGTSHPHTEESKTKIATALMGNKNAIGKGRPKGILHTMKWREKMSIKNSGKGNPNYIDGKGRERARKRNQDRHNLKYRLWREQVFERDDFACQGCNKRGVILHAHHIKGWVEYPKLRYMVSNGQALCERCHLKTRTMEV